MIQLLSNGKNRLNHGQVVEKTCFNIMKRQFPELEDRSADWSGMDWYNPTTKEAIEFKNYNVVSKGEWTISKEKFDKYRAYIDNTEDVDFGTIWILDNQTNSEFRINFELVDHLVTTEKVAAKFNKTTREDWECGIFYCIPLKYFFNITGANHCISSYATLK